MFKRAIIVLSIAGVVVLAAAIDLWSRRHRGARDVRAGTASAPDHPRPGVVAAGAPPTIPASVRAPTSLSRRAPAPARDARPLPLDEAALMTRLRELGETNPALSLQLAREALARFPDGPDAPERNWIVVKSLVNLERFDEARAEARAMVERFPDDAKSLDVRRHLLTNPP